jgi:hypothetical protein
VTFRSGFDHVNNEDQASPSFLHQLSYDVHTNRELEFMLRGIKPLAWFSDMIFDDSDIWEPDEGFERQVQSGAFVKHEVRETWEPYPFGDHLVRGKWHRFYALKDEAWRIPAFILLKKVGDKHPWNDALERLEGSLLGYTDEQNDEWLAKRHAERAGWQCVTLYAIVAAQVLDEIAELGNRAFPKEALRSLQLFTAKSIPTQQALEQTGLLEADADCRLIRFGVNWHFLKDCLEYKPAAGIALASIRSGVETRDLNKALRTDIQIFDLR